MKKVLKNLAVISAVMLLVLVLSSIKFAQSATIDDVDVVGLVKTPLGITALDYVLFGAFVSGSSGGTINPTHTTITGSVEGLSAGHDALFEVTGEPYMSAIIEIAPSCTLYNMNGTPGAYSMDVDLSVTPNYVNIDASGVGTFSPIATLNVNADQYPDLYSGTFSINVHY